MRRACGADPTRRSHGVDPARRACGGESSEEGTRWWVRCPRHDAMVDPSRSDSTPSRSGNSTAHYLSLCVL
jgi:hypothetical protein